MECVGVNCGLSSPTRRFQFPGKVLGLSLSFSVSLSVSRAFEQCSPEHGVSYGSAFSNPGAEMVVFRLGEREKIRFTTPSIPNGFDRFCLYAIYSSVGRFHADLQSF